MFDGAESLPADANYTTWQVRPKTTSNYPHHRRRRRRPNRKNEGMRDGGQAFASNIDRGARDTDSPAARGALHEPQGPVRPTKTQDGHR